MFSLKFPLVMNGYKSWTIKKAQHQRIDAFELWCWRRLLKIPWTARKSNQLILREIKPLIFSRRTDAEAEAPVFWSSDVNRLIGKVPSAGKYWGQKEKRASEDEMVGQHYWCNEHEFGQTPGHGEGQGTLACCSHCGCKKLDMTGWLNNNNIGN